MTFIGTHIKITDEKLNSKEIVPAPHRMCPGSNCAKDGMQKVLFFEEFLGSVIFYFSWLMIRKYDVQDGPNGKNNL